MRSTAIIALVAALGCSSQYMPRSPRRVAVTIRDGKPAYVRDGRVFDVGPLGGGLDEVVAGNPDAVAAANEYHSRLVDGLLGAVLGAASMAVGGGWAAREAVVDSNNQNLATPLVLLAGGLVLILAGSLYAASAEPYRWDAINIFNDAADQTPAWPPTATFAPPSDSLHMRAP
jgi:hypothetical protein